MCGICGFTSADTNGLLARMTDAIAHRGPDAEGFFRDAKVSFGHRRLSIIDLEGGVQPMTDPRGGVTVVFNGEIYNFEELRVLLEGRGIEFITKSDTEVLLHAYREWGESFLTKLRGMFAFALWDASAQKLLLARDHTGIKPLYYLENHGTLYFSSEIKSFLAADLTLGPLDADALTDFFLFSWTLGTRTLHEKVKKLTPGTLMVWENGSSRSTTFWQPEFIEKDWNQEELLLRIREELIRSVREQRIADTPLGLTLSGGLDSASILAASAADSAPSLHSFSLGYGLDDDEVAAASLVTNHLGTPLRSEKVSVGDAASALPKVMWHLEEPTGNYVGMTTFLLAQFLRRHLKVVLIGEGSDELFGGYTRYKIFSDRFKFVPMAFRAPFYRWPGHFAVAIRSIAAASPIISAARAWDHGEAYLNTYFRGRKESPLNRALRFDILNELPNNQLLRVDKLTMAHGVEARVPFLDHEFISLVMSASSRLKMPTLREKGLLRDAMKQYLPAPTISQPKGRSQYILRSVLESGLLKNARTLFKDSRAVGHGVIHQKFLDKVAAAVSVPTHSIQRMTNEVTFFMLLSLELWIRLFVERERVDHLSEVFHER